MSDPQQVVVDVLSDFLRCDSNGDRLGGREWLNLPLLSGLILEALGGARCWNCGNTKL